MHNFKCPVLNISTAKETNMDKRGVCSLLVKCTRPEPEWATRIGLNLLVHNKNENICLISNYFFKA